MIGRIKELHQLQEAFESAESEFVAIYGRRRVGKTYLVRETFEERLSFQHTGVANGSRTTQLSEFRKSLIQYGLVRKCGIRSWFDAFDCLGQLLSKKSDGKKVVFLDELPWMDTVRSDFVSALEHFWNGWASARKDILLIVCGSATSWMLDHVIKDRGGLHNRVTINIFLEPFSLRECELYALSRGITMSHLELTEAYMITGWRALYPVRHRLR